jgi:hypothetical protein
MPVATNTTISNAAVDGGIDIVKVKTGGSSFSSTGSTITGIPIRGDGSGGVVTVTLTGDAISSVTVTSVGSGYTFGYITDSDINCWYKLKWYRFWFRIRCNYSTKKFNCRWFCLWWTRRRRSKRIRCILCNVKY